MISSVTGYFTPRLITAFYEALNKEEAFQHQLMLLVFLYAGEYLNRILFTLSTHRYIQMLLIDLRKRS